MGKAGGVFVDGTGADICCVGCRHPELKVTVQLPIISVKKNPQNPMYTQLGVLTKGTIIEVNVSDLGLMTAGGKVIWGKWAQVTNNPEMVSPPSPSSVFVSVPVSVPVLVPVPASCFLLVQAVTAPLLALASKQGR